MDNEILTTLISIKYALYLLITIVSVGVIANWVRAGIALKRQYREELENIFTTDASALYESGKYNELITLCDEQLNKKPNHSYAHWYKAKAYYQLKDYGKAKSFLNILASLEPSWDESHIQPILRKIHDTESETH